MSMFTPLRVILASAPSATSTVTAALLGTMVPQGSSLTIFTPCMVTLAAAFSSALTVTVLVVGVSLLDWTITGASSGTAALEPWVTVCPLSVAITVTLPSARSYSAAKADIGRLQTSSRAIILGTILLSFIGIRSPFSVCAAAHTRRDAIYRNAVYMYSPFYYSRVSAVWEYMPKKKSFFLACMPCSRARGKLCS